jgi:hypothetical protein
MTTEAEQVLKALQTAPDEGWIERDELLELADSQLPDEDLDTRIGAAWDIFNELNRAGYHVEYVREVAGTFFRLKDRAAGSSGDEPIEDEKSI